MEVKPNPTLRREIDLMLRLAYAAYAGCYNPGGIGAAWEIRRLLGKVAPEQEIVWGPVDAGNILDLFSVAMAYISREDSPANKAPVYTLAVRGTNPVSWTTIVAQDLDVRATVPWQLVSPHANINLDIDPYIIGGASLTLSLLDKLKSHRQSLLDFLLDKAENENAKIRITGHSLGGLTTSILAVWLQEEFLAKGVSVKKRFSAYPIAGLTPGNSDFASHSQVLCKSNDNRLLRIVTGLDFAPRAWIQQELGTEVPGLYSPDVTLTEFDRQLIKFFYNMSLNRDYAHTPDFVQLPSALAPEMKYWMVQFLHQHMNGYLNYLHDPAARKTLLRMLHLELLKGCPRTELRFGLSNREYVLPSLQQLCTLLFRWPLAPGKL